MGSRAVFEFGGRCCCGDAISCPQWNACLPNRLSVSLSFVCRIIERWNSQRRGGGEWVVDAEATFVRVNSGANAYMVLQTGKFSWHASADYYSFHGDSFAGSPCYPCRSAYLSQTSVAVPIIDRPLIASVTPNPSIPGGTFPFCFRCPNTASDVFSVVSIGMEGPFQWTDTFYRENGSQNGQLIRNSNQQRYVQVASTRAGCLNDRSFKEYSILAFGSACDGPNGCGLVPGRNPWWWGTGEKNCTNNEKSFGACSDSGGQPISRPRSNMGWSVVSCPNEIYDQHSCFNQTPPLQCGTSIYFPPYNEDGVVSRTIEEEVVSAFQITNIS